MACSIKALLVLCVVLLAMDASASAKVGSRFKIPPLPAVEGPITGPGRVAADLFESLQPEAEAAAEFGYVFKEYFVSGRAAGRSYDVRMLVARPAKLRRFSGHVLVEPKHPIGYPFVWNFTRLYLMARGHAAVELSLLPRNLEYLRGYNPERYADLHVSEAQIAPILAQAGRLLKSDGKPKRRGSRAKRARSPLPGVERLYLTGHSMSAGPTWPYMHSYHERLRLKGGAPIYDAFFPETTRTASRFGRWPDVDVPTIVVASQLEVQEVIADDGINYRKPDSDRPGRQFRLYEVAGMPHHDSRVNPIFQREPCDRPLNRFPYKPMVMMALDHLIRWVDKGVRPPRAKRISVIGGPGGEIELDAFGNAVGGVRSTYVDVPVATHSPLNSGADGNCGVLGSQLPFATERLLSLYGTHARYVDRVKRRLRRLIRQGWYLRRFAPELRREAAQFDGFEGSAGR